MGCEEEDVLDDKDYLCPGSLWKEETLWDSEDVGKGV